MRRLFILLMIATVPASAEIVDRIVANVGHDVVTLSDVQAEQRMTCFLEGGPREAPSIERVRELAGKLADRILMRQEMASGVFPLSPQEELDAALGAVRKRFPNTEDYQAALNRCGVTEKQWVQYLSLQSEILNFIDFRVRPGLQVSAQETRAYYDETLVPGWRARNEAVRPFEAVRDSIVQTLTEQRVNERLDAWLKELRAQTEIRIR